MFNKLKNIFKKNQPVWNEFTGEVNITQASNFISNEKKKIIYKNAFVI
jgi:hypothetical protein